MSGKKKEESMHECLNIIILGDSLVGKTSILDRYCNSKFSFTQSTYKTAEVFKKSVTVKDNLISIKLSMFLTMSPGISV